MTIELRKFISQALTEIAGGVKDAQAPVREMGGQVAPHDIDSHGSDRIKGQVLFSNNRPIQIISFDVAVTVADETGGKAGLGVFSGLVSLGAGGTTKDSAQIVNRIQFTVPIVLPQDRSNEQGDGVSLA